MTIFRPPEDDPQSTRFEIFDLQMLLGYGMIAWALAASISLTQLLRP